MGIQGEVNLGGLVRYLPIIDILPEQQRRSLIESLSTLKKIGVQEYGRRIIYNNGYSHIVTTSERWIDAFNSHSLKASMTLHMSNEVLQVKRNNFALITRSPDKISNEYLKVLDYLGLNNSVIKYHFFKNHVEISYFVAEKDDNFARDVFINKISLLEEIEKKILPSLIKIESSNTSNQEKELLLPQEVMNTLFKSGLKKSFKCEEFVSDISPDLDYKDLSYLAYLAFECTNKYIARTLGISESTVKVEISNLKTKLNIENRMGLVSFASSPKIKHLVRTIGII